MVFGHVLSHHQTNNPLAWTMPIYNQSERPRLTVDVNAAGFHLLGQNLDQQRTAVITLDVKVMTARCWRVLIDIGPGFLATGVQQTVIGKRHHGSLGVFRILEGHTQGHQPVEMGCTTLGIGPHFGRISLGAIRVHQVAVNGLDTVVVTDRFLHRRAAPQVEFG